MAVMIPKLDYIDDFNYSHGEYALYQKLQKLPDEYYVFYSTRWNEKRRSETMPQRQYIQWGEADFTIFHPKKGIIVFEVKDGIIEYSREKGWTQKNRKTGAKKCINPLEQAEKSKYYFRELLKQAFDGNCPCRMCSAVWFTSSDERFVRGKLPLDYKDELICWGNDLDDINTVKSAIERVYNYCESFSYIDSNEKKQKVLDTLAPEFGCFESLHTRTLISEDLFERMTREQTGLLDYLEEQELAAIQGIAGTGKTIIALQKAQRLATSDKVLFLCFNRFLKNHLSSCYDNTNIEFHNLDSLYACKTKTCHSGGEKRDEEISEFLLDWEKYDWDYKHIIIDEAQDFCQDHLECLLAIAEKQKGCFYVFYDKNQFVQGKEYPIFLDEMECRLVLSRNCRNTKEIATTSTRPIGIAEEKIRLKHDRTDELPKPNLFFVQSSAEVKDYISQLITRYMSVGIKPSEIVVLSCKSEGNSCLTKGDYRINDSFNLAETVSERRKNKDILFTTVRMFKGLEAKVVICIDIDEDTFSTKEERSSLYVGTSRAKMFLELITIESPEKMAEAITKETVKGPRSRSVIANALKVKIGSSKDLMPEKAIPLN